MATWKSLNSGPDAAKSLTLKPPLEKGHSYVSKLSSDEGSMEEEEENTSSDGEALACRKCGGKDFRARKAQGRGQKLVCKRCGAVAE
jgi:ribosomal protein L40E